MPKIVRPKSRRDKHRVRRLHFDFGHSPDFLILALVAGLTIFGLLMIYNVSAYEGFREFNDKLYFAKQQLIWIMIGSVGGMAGYLLPYRKFLKISPVILLVVVVLLILVLIPGIGSRVLGAKRWINLGTLFPMLPSFTVQPAELVKPAVILYFAAWLTKKTGQFSWHSLVSFGLVGLTIIGLVMLEPDLGTSVVIVSTIGAMYFFAGAPIVQFAAMIPVGLLGLIGLIVQEPYRLKRLLTFLDPTSDPQGASYHINQILVTLGSGGLFGVGLGNSGQKYGYLPEATTDSIFAVIAGELGFIGSVILITVFLLLVFQLFKVTRGLPERDMQLVALGVSLWLATQIIVNMGSMVALFPLTGVPLPFISYGGSSLVTTLFATGLILNLSRYTKQPTRRPD